MKNIRTIVSGIRTAVRGWWKPKLAYGTCGIQLEWTLYADGTLLVSGEGGMDDYLRSPWDGYYAEIKRVVIGEGVVNLGDNVFRGCTELGAIAIPASLSAIGRHALCNCDRLAEINVAEGNACYCSLDGVLFSKDRSVLVKCPEGKLEAVYTVPSGVVRLGNCAFSHCIGLMNVTLGRDVKEIGETAFLKCLSLAEMTVRAVVPPKVQPGAFGMAGTENAVSRDIPVYVPEGSVAAYRNADGWKEFTGIRPLCM